MIIPVKRFEINLIGEIGIGRARLKSDVLNRGEDRATV